MALEVGTYINSLNASNPIKATDVVAEGADHFQLVKSTIKNTFPNISNAISATHYDLSALTNVTSAGTSSAYTATITPSSAFTLQAGVGLILKPHTACIDNPTLNVNATGAKNLVTKDGVNLVANQLLTTAYYTVVYNGTSYVVSESDNSTIYGAKTFAGGTLNLSNATSNVIAWNTSGVTGPTFTNRSAGTKLVLYPSIGTTSADYALGIEGGTLWSSVGTTSNAFRWYGGTTLAATLTGAGNLTTTGTITGTNISASGGISGNTITGAAGVTATSGHISASAGDIYTHRSGAANTGIIWLGNSGARYLYFDGTNYTMPGSWLYTNSQLVLTSSAFGAGYQTLNSGTKYFYGNATTSQGLMDVTFPAAFTNVNSYCITVSSANVGVIATIERLTAQTARISTVNHAGTYVNSYVSYIAIGY